MKAWVAVPVVLDEVLCHLSVLDEPVSGFGVAVQPMLASIQNFVATVGSEKVVAEPVAVNEIVGAVGEPPPETE